MSQKTYQRKPQQVQAEQVGEVMGWNSSDLERWGVTFIRYLKGMAGATVRHEATQKYLTLHAGDWLVSMEDGSLVVHNDEAFHLLYEEVPA